MRKSLAIFLLLLFLSVIGIKSWHALNHNHKIVDKVHSCDLHQHGTNDSLLLASSDISHCLICDFEFTSFKIEYKKLFFQKHYFYVHYLEGFKSKFSFSCFQSIIFLRGPPSCIMHK